MHVHVHAIVNNCIYILRMLLAQMYKVLAWGADEVKNFVIYRDFRSLTNANPFHCKEYEINIASRYKLHKISSRYKHDFLSVTKPIYNFRGSEPFLG